MRIETRILLGAITSSHAFKFKNTHKYRVTILARPVDSLSSEERKEIISTIDLGDFDTWEEYWSDFEEYVRMVAPSDIPCKVQTENEALGERADLFYLLSIGVLPEYIAEQLQADGINIEFIKEQSDE